MSDILTTTDDVNRTPDAEQSAPVDSETPWALTMRQLARDKVAVTCASVLAFFFLIAIFAPVIAPYDPFMANPEHSLAPPSAAHPFGADLIGRDILSRVLYGARLSLFIGFVSVAISSAVGILLGLVAGFYGKFADTLIMRFIDMLMAFPGILLALTVVALLGPGLTNVMIAVGIGGVANYARLVRGSVLSVREQPYIQAIRAVGAGDLRIIFQHILPNALPPVLVLVSMSYGWALLSAAGLSFLGLGAEPPTVEWGSMLNDARSLLRAAPWTAVFPGLSIMCVVLASNLLGESLRDALDPTQRMR
ncbi:ABC transporter permease [Hyphococcus sp.]|uniref:ABC transporter permease n=1 Tax=Hyphococcus sp. TaxID=2038636 RepID=UPI003CCBD2BC